MREEVDASPEIEKPSNQKPREEDSSTNADSIVDSFFFLPRPPSRCSPNNSPASFEKLTRTVPLISSSPAGSTPELEDLNPLPERSQLELGLRRRRLLTCSRSSKREIS